MTSPSWNHPTLVKVVAQPEGFWTLAVDYVPGPRLLKIRVSGRDDAGHPVPIEWTVNSGLAAPRNCQAFGLGAGGNRGAYLSPAAPLGALIAKIGGSPVDLPDPTQAAAPYGSKKVYPVGQQAILVLAQGDSGPLYLTMNDEPANFSQHDGALWVEICDATP